VRPRPGKHTTYEVKGWHHRKNERAARCIAMFIPLDVMREAVQRAGIRCMRE